MWFPLALFSAIFYSFRNLLEKKNLVHTDPYILALAVRLFALPLFTLPFIFGIAHFPKLEDISLQFWLAVSFTSFLGTPFEMIFFYKALKMEEISYVVPLLGLGPIITTIVNAIIFHDLPNIWGIVGVLVIVLSLYLLNIQKKGEKFLDPFKHLSNNPAFKYVLIMLGFASVSLVTDKLGVTHSSIYFYSLINYILVSFTLLVIALFKSRSNLHQVKTNFSIFMLIGIVVAIYTWLRFASLEAGNAGYVSAVLASNVLFTIVLGIILYKEKKWQRKLVVGILILIGLAVIKLLG